MDQTPTAPESGKWLLAGLVAIFVLVYILPLGNLDLFSPDETRYGEIPREMIASGDWVVPHLNGVRYFEKPVLGYWVHAGSLLLFGENPFAVRLPSAMSVGLAAWLVYLLIARRTENQTSPPRRKATLASLVFLTCAEVFGVGNTAVLDSLFALFLTATLTAFFFATEAKRRSRQELQLLLAAGIACGLAFLTKGFLAFAVIGVVLPPYLAWQRRPLDILRMCWIPGLAAFLVALPWGMAIHAREPDFWNFFFWNEHVRRFAGENAQHSEPLWRFWLAAAGMFTPWVFMVPAAAAGLRRRISHQDAQGRLIRLSICWLVLPFLLVSLSRGKLLTYILPCFPPFSILISLGLSHLLEKHPASKRFQSGAIAGAVLFGLMLAALLWAQGFGFDGSPLYSSSWQPALAAAALAWAVFFCLRASRSRNANRKLIFFGISPVFLFFAIHFTIPDQTLENKSSVTLLERNRRHVTGETIVISDATAIQAVCWQYKRNDVFMLAYSGELDYGLRREDAAGRLLDLASGAKMIHQNRGHVVLITRARHFALICDQLPPPATVDESSPAGYVFVRY